MNKERLARTLPGIPMLLGLIAAVVVLAVALIWWIGAIVVPAGDGVGFAEMVPFFGLMLALIAVCVAFGGLTPVNPNEARALVLLGRYKGTVNDQGLHWVNPFT